MSDETCYLIAVLYGDVLLRVAMKIPNSKLTMDERDYPMEPENRNKFHSMLPCHVQSCGPIVEIDSRCLFEVCEVAK